MKQDNDIEKAIIIAERQKYRDDYTSRMKSCSYCHYTGTIAALHKPTDLMYSFRCDKCDAANRQKLSAGLPQWNAVNPSEYQIMK